MRPSLLANLRTEIRPPCRCLYLVLFLTYDGFFGMNSQVCWSRHRSVLWFGVSVVLLSWCVGL